MTTRNTVFKPSKAETKADATTKIVRGIIDAETAARHEKQRRLKAARLEREAAEKKLAAAAPPKKETRKASAKRQPAKG